MAVLLIDWDFESKDPKYKDMRDGLMSALSNKDIHKDSKEMSGSTYAPLTDTPANVVFTATKKFVERIAGRPLKKTESLNVITLVPPFHAHDQALQEWLEANLPVPE